MNSEPAFPLAPQPRLAAPAAGWTHPLIWGAVFGTFAAVGYTAANIFLRSVAHADPVWVSCVKSFPTVLFAGPWLLGRRLAGHTVFPAPRVLGALLLAGLIGQLFGNVLFQWALGVIGLALTVPLTMGTIIITGAIWGRMFLGEPVTRRAAVSMAVLIAAICTLSLGAPDAFQSVVREQQAGGTAGTWWRLATAVMAACFSGLAYSGLGVVIRHGVNGRATVSTTLFIIGSVGTVALGIAAFGRIGTEGMLQTQPAEWRTMAAAGIFNFVAFLALTRALQLTTVVYVNSINASQVALAALAGVLLFREAPTLPMWTGVLLTASGLILMSVRRMPRRDKDKR